MRAEEGSGDKTYDQYRPLLFSIAYRMLGSVMDAEDMTQEVFVRWRAPEGEVRSPKAYLSAVVTRLCIDRLRSAWERREDYVGPWLPEPLPDERAPDAAETLALEESLSMTFLVLLESLTPVERAVFLLREVLDYDYSEVARIVGKEGANSCKHPILHGYLIPLVHRLKGNETVRAELSARRDHREAPSLPAVRFHAAWESGEGHGTTVVAPPERALAEVERLRRPGCRSRARFSSPGPWRWRLCRDSACRRVDPAPLGPGARFRPTLLADDPDRGRACDGAGQMRRMSGGTTPTFEDAGGFSAFDRPGYAKVAMGLSARPVAGRTELATETRVSTTDPASRQNFKLYWRVIRPGSALARCSRRRAVRLRAEQASTAGLGLVG